MCIYAAHFKLKRDDNFSIKDKVAGHKCVHYLTEVATQRE